MFSDNAKRKLKEASSGLTGSNFERLPVKERNEYIKNIDNVLMELVVTEPYAFTHEGWLELMKKQKKEKGK